MQIREAAKVRNRQTTWYVPSETNPTQDPYIVHNKRNEISHHKVWTCNCPDFTERRQFNGTDCKHIDAVRTYVSLKIAAEAVERSVTGAPVRETLDSIVKILKGPRTEAKQLWDILTALRGPDSDNNDLKAITTASIRGAIGLNQNNVGAITNNEKPFGADLDLNAGSQGYYEIADKLRANFRDQAQFHFISHYRAALTALKQLDYIK